jgi:hypothetical protein
MSVIDPIKVSDFSSHLFWDINKDELDLNTNRSFIVKRALEYGLMQDWNLINRYYGFVAIVEMAKTFRSLEPKTFSFILTLSGLQKEAFRCSTIKQ